jgi:hypothetical protein
MKWKRYITSMSGTTVRRSPGREGTPQAEPKPTLPQTAAEVLNKHVRLEVESIDRMYLNVIVGRLQIVEGALRFIRQQRKAKVLSTNAVEPMTRAFVQAIERFVKDHHIPLISFEKDSARTRSPPPCAPNTCTGKAWCSSARRKRNARYRTEKRHNPKHNTSYAWIVKSTALVNHYYFYWVDENFGPFSSSSVPTFPTMPSFA